jgi:predicted NUDIX family phosphoesterase
LITIIDNGEIFTLIAKRSKNNTEYPDHFELVPSGNLDSSVKNEHGEINYKNKLLEELEEETGISKDNVKDVFEIGVVKDNKNLVYDICCLIKINSNKEIIKKQIKKTTEYSNLQFIKIKEFEKRKFSKKDKFVPTSLGIMKLFLKL